MSQDKVLRWLNAGQLHGLKIGDEWRTSTHSLAAFLEAHANRPAPKPLGRRGQGQLYAFTRRERA